MNKLKQYLTIPITTAAIALFSADASADGMKKNQGRNLLDEKVQKVEKPAERRVGDLKIETPDFFDNDATRQRKTKALWDAYVRGGIFGAEKSTHGFGEGQFVFRPEEFDRLRVRLTGGTSFSDLARKHDRNVRSSTTKGTAALGYIWGDDGQLYTEMGLYGTASERTGDVKDLGARGAGISGLVGAYFKPTRTKVTVEGKHTLDGYFDGELRGAEHGQNVSGRYTQRELKLGIVQELFKNEDFRVRALAQGSVAKQIYDKEGDSERFYDVLSASISGTLDGTIKFGEDHYLTVGLTGRQRLFKSDFSTGHSITERTEAALGLKYRPASWLAAQLEVGQRWGRRGSDTNDTYAALSLQFDIKGPSKSK